MADRRNRKNTRRDRKRRNRRSQWGGVAPVEYVMGQDMTAQSLAQGKQFLAMHANQHGGASVGYEGGPFPGSVQEQSLLPSNLHASARVAPLNAAINEIQGMKDQGGGRRRNRKNTRRDRKNRKNRKASRKNRKTRNRKQNGGSYKLDTAADYNGPSMLLPSGLEAKALGGMNAEWALAKNPSAFAPGL
jgi:hypothetical protein